MSQMPELPDLCWKRRPQVRLICSRADALEIFLNNTNLTFLAFLYKIVQGVSKSAKIKLPPVGIELTTPTI